MIVLLNACKNAMNTPTQYRRTKLFKKLFYIME